MSSEEAHPPAPGPRTWRPEVIYEALVKAGQEAGLSTALLEKAYEVIEIRTHCDQVSLATALRECGIPAATRAQVRAMLEAAPAPSPAPDTRDSESEARITANLTAWVRRELKSNMMDDSCLSASAAQLFKEAATQFGVDEKLPSPIAAVCGDVAHTLDVLSRNKAAKTAMASFTTKFTKVTETATGEQKLCEGFIGCFRELLTAVGRPTGSWDAKLLSALFAELVVIDTQNKPYLGPHALKPDVTIARSGTARHQLCGVDVVNCGEFKWGERKNALLTGENLGQCIQQGDTVLQCQPVRPYLFTYLADESGVVFLKFIGGKLDSAKFHFRSLLFSGVVPWTEAIPWLLATIVGDCQSYTMPRLSAGYYFTRYLGRGASGVVYEVKGPAGAGDGTGVVAKVFTVGTPTAEREVLAELGRAGVPNTPRLHEAEVGLDPCASHLLLTPLCVNAPDVVFTANHALEILSALQGAHDLGYVHRDVRPANIMFHDDSAHLIDWSFAVKTSELTAPVSFAGTTRCAHEDLLRAAFGASGGAYRYLPKPSDDFHAWVRACYLLAFPRLDKFLRRIAGSEAHPDVANLINFWNNVFGCSPLWAELRDAASVCDVGNLARLIMGLLPHKELVGLGAGE